MRLLTLVEGNGERPSVIDYLLSISADGRIGVPRPIAKLVRLLILHHGPTEREST